MIKLLNIIGDFYRVLGYCIRWLGLWMEKKEEFKRLIKSSSIFNLFDFRIRIFQRATQKAALSSKRSKKLRRCFFLSLFSRTHFRIDSAIPENSAMHVRLASRTQDDLLFLSCRGSSPGLPPSKATKKDVPIGRERGKREGGRGVNHFTRWNSCPRKSYTQRG